MVVLVFLEWWCVCMVVLVFLEWWVCVHGCSSILGVVGVCAWLF